MIILSFSVSASLSRSLSGSVQLEVRLMPATNKFEISENGNLAVSGTSPFICCLGGWKQTH